MASWVQRIASPPNEPSIGSARAASTRGALGSIRAAATSMRLVCSCPARRPLVAVRAIEIGFNGLPIDATTRNVPGFAGSGAGCGGGEFRQRDYYPAP